MKKNLRIKIFTNFAFLTFIFQFGCNKFCPAPNNKTLTGKILFTYYGSHPQDNTYGIWTINNDGTNKQRLNITLPGNTVINTNIPLKMSPDKRLIFFNAFEHDSTYVYRTNIYSCNLNGSNVQKVIIAANNNNYRASSTLCDVYFDGQQSKILYLNYGVNLELFTANLDGSMAQKINFNLIDGLTAIDYNSAKVSPDGKTIFFASNLNDPATISSFNMDGSNIKTLISSNIHNNSYVIGGTYTLNQQPKLFFYQNTSLPTCFVTCNLDGTSPQYINLKFQEYNYLLFGISAPKISNDGTLVFFSISNDGIYSCSMDGNNLKHIMLQEPNEVLMGDTF